MTDGHDVYRYTSYSCTPMMSLEAYMLQHNQWWLIIAPEYSNKQSFRARVTVNLITN